MAEVVGNRKRVVIPKGIDINKLFEDYDKEIKELKKHKLKDKIYYFLSRVVTHEGNIHLYLKDDGYRPIPSKRMDEIFGSRDSRTIKKILTNKQDRKFQDSV